ncbi:farnesyl diphosphate synthase [Cognatiyoonia sp. IB215446]|uniref:polyprenyl synthetase family protein n=1 Tax=Cognatiyoonia sp. IB215446 TaxID=3097355 RepID=UPI002A13FFB0|nr:farnesyl diphosphate synthase [Cognatiyoonia sp. IB215446]MDX8346377.1 farnesyl diphosphate synthase [Cognatiyoonia sp. IB215446]
MADMTIRIAALERRPLQDAMAQAAKIAEARIGFALSGLDGVVPEAMLYAVTGGKALRSFLALETARLHGINPASAAGAASAIEAIHAYSLIHDDLPCMDDDDLRRGQPSVHKKWDEATAVLAGDGLQALAFELLMQAECAPRAKLNLVISLANAAGIRGMVGGQAADIAAEQAVQPLSLDQIMDLQAGKTGALIGWSALVGPRLAEAEREPLSIYGANLGLAFQIADDILDITGDADAMGKAVGKDAAAGKATFVSHLGLDGAKGRAAELVAEACDGLSPYGDDAETLKEAAQFVIARTH